MKSIGKGLKLAIFGLLAMGFLLALSACGEERVEMDQQYLKEAEQRGKDMRAVFEGAGGKWSAMSDSVREEYVGRFKTEEEAKFIWLKMKFPDEYRAAIYVPGQTVIDESRLE